MNGSTSQSQSQSQSHHCEHSSAADAARMQIGSQAGAAGEGRARDARMEPSRLAVQCAVAARYLGVVVPSIVTLAKPSTGARAATRRPTGESAEKSKLCPLPVHCPSTARRLPLS
ncbi:hypothetical protein SNOG_15255 [Parastagonospora nodorum SN15]|uniref:Uncharacterized protein n=1 Tax=Phaeosphaeria nodorum (strain SN15 / ATCC MYA-4574 / FGSC 10173) TaxID=321614 RepID=Q0TZC8_PHANO|nr:hypothetical protein SNOG_15255 [Parastagonospora nodorum SN15]EAT77480.1 hypothetical protein SNOG_15255 [Parastagonospora nodorum SN15]